ncbi:DUF3179 domain-containing protein [Candidatus Uhrbacteria bacterium]|nr:DUF3179 domain-containing protein [Candidatus Uhrbacteria bacterium]
MQGRGRIFLGILAVFAVVLFIAEYRARTAGPRIEPFAQSEGWGIPREEVYDSGLSSSSIPAIDAPAFISPSEADIFLYDEGEGVSLSLGGETQFYPFQILVWHMVVNDMIAGVPIVVTYDPLVGSAMVYDRRVEGRTLLFSVSGKLWNSNVLLLDRETGSLWPQTTGRAVNGEFLDRDLAPIGSEIVTWKKWKAQRTTGRVLSKNTGAVRDYTRNPYLGYEENRLVYFPLSRRDIRLHPKELVFGYTGPEGETKAYPREYLVEEGSITDTVLGRKVVMTFNENTGVLRARGEDVAGVASDVFLRPMYWFAWAAIHPDTELYDPLGEKQKVESEQQEGE